VSSSGLEEPYLLPLIESILFLGFFRVLSRDLDFL
jgi:hypothetical protein